MNYKEKLKDERWLRRKREILIRDNYSCCLCGHKGIDEHELHVHHLEYIYGKEPWEYDDFHLATLCSNCHEWVHKTNMTLRMRISRISHKWICEEIHDWTKQENYNGVQLLIEPGTILASDESDSIFVAADYPYYNYFDTNGEYHVSGIKKCRHVEALFTLNTTNNDLSVNEYNFPLEGVFSINARYATDEEKQRILDAIKNFTKIAYYGNRTDLRSKAYGQERSYSQDGKADRNHQRGKAYSKRA